MRKIFLLLFLVTSVINGFAQVDLTKGLMLYLPFNGNTLDASPNANHAVNYGATLTADQWGNPNSAYRFNGVSGYMKIANSTSLQINDQITLCARVEVRGFFNGNCYGNSIIDKGSPDFLSGNYGLRFSSMSGGCSYLDTTDQNYYGYFHDQYAAPGIISTSPYVVAKQWDCLIYVYDGNMAKMYVNGILRHQYPSSSSIGINSQDVFLGRHDDATYPYWFNGNMDEVRIYNRALNTAEIDSVCSKSRPQITAVIDAHPTEVLPVVSNPVNDMLQLSLPSDKIGGSLNIIDLSGRVLIHIDNLRDTTIPVTDMPAGIYLISYETEGILMRAKMVKR